MEITLFNRTNADITCYEPLFEKIAERTKKVLKLKKEYQLSVTFVRSRTIHTINRDYRGIDRPTDVITFAAMDDGEFFTEEEEADLGDIFINIDYDNDIRFKPFELSGRCKQNTFITSYGGDTMITYLLHSI